MDYCHEILPGSRWDLSSGTNVTLEVMRVRRLLIPRPLDTGDTIGVVSAYSVIARELRPQLRRGIKVLKSLGFKVLLGKSALKTRDYSAGSSRERAEDINSMFANPGIKAIIDTAGGETGNSLLPLLDYKLIRRNPKIVLGLSDFTFLLNAIHMKTGLITFHGPNLVWCFGRSGPYHYDISEFLDRLMRSRIGNVRRESEWRTVRDGRAKGRLVGGNLGCLAVSAGTPYFPDFTDSIMFIESFTLTPGMCDEYFTQMEQMGVFDKLRGVIVGYIHSLQSSRTKQIQMEDVLLNVTSDYDFPILKVNEFGHNCPNTVIPIGGMASLDAGKKEWKILDACVAEKAQS